MAARLDDASVHRGQEEGKKRRKEEIVKGNGSEGFSLASLSSSESAKSQFVLLSRHIPDLS